MKTKTVVERPCQEFNLPSSPPLGYFCFPYESPMILTFISFPSLQYVEAWHSEYVYNGVVKIWHLLIDTAILCLNLIIT